MLRCLANLFMAIWRRIKRYGCRCALAAAMSIIRAYALALMILYCVLMPVLLMHCNVA